MEKKEKQKWKLFQKMRENWKNQKKWKKNSKKIKSLKWKRNWKKIKKTKTYRKIDLKKMQNYKIAKIKKKYK